MNPFHQRVYDQLRGVANGMTLELITSRLGEAKSPVRTALQALQEAGHVTLKGKRWFDADAAQVGDVAGADSEAAPTAEVPAVDGGAAASDADAALPSPPTPTAARPEPVDPTAERAADAVRALGLEPTIGDVDPTTGTRSVTYRLPPMEAPAGPDAEQDEIRDAVSHGEASDATAADDEPVLTEPALTIDDKPKPKPKPTPRRAPQITPARPKSPFVQVGSFVLGRHGAVHVQANASGVAVRLFPAHTVQVDAPLSAFGYLIGTDPWDATKHLGWVTIGDHMVQADEHLVYAQRTPEGGATLHCRFRINDDGDHGMVQLHVASFEDVVAALKAEVVYTPPPVDPTAERAADAIRALGLEPTIGDSDPTTGTRSVTYRLPPMEAPAGSDAEQDDTPDAVSHDEASGATASNDEMFDDMARELGMLKSSLRRSRLTLSLWQSGTHMVDPCHIARLANEDGERPDAYLRAVAHRLCLAADQLELAADVAKIAWLGKKAEPPPGDLATAAAAQAAGL
jgi:hypothetical protein